MCHKENFINDLYNLLSQRKKSDPDHSYTAQLLEKGTAKIAQKVGEEATECVIEAVSHNKKALINESSDLIYHLVVLWLDAGIKPRDIARELHKREAMSGIAEKASRTKK